MARIPWNKGKLTGPKPPLQPKHVWAIRTHLQISRKTRDLALFNLAIDSKLRGCDVVSIKVEDVAPNGYAFDRASVRQKKTGRPVKFEITDNTREAIDAYLRTMGKKSGDYLFSCYLDIRRLKVPFVILASKSTMPWPLPNKLRSEGRGGAEALHFPYFFSE